MILFCERCDRYDEDCTCPKTPEETRWRAELARRRYIDRWALARARFEKSRPGRK